jgi:hypothetical protein
MSKRRYLMEEEPELITKTFMFFSKGSKVQGFRGSKVQGLRVQHF